MARSFKFNFLVQDGGLMSYGASQDDNYLRAASYVDRIFKGATPSALPVERPSRYYLTINVKTAKALGLTIPPSLLLSGPGDRVMAKHWLVLWERECSSEWAAQSRL